MKKFIDIHTHILPGVDDGSESMTMSSEMLRIAAEEGITTIIATPHYIPGVGYFKLQDRIDAYIQLKRHINDQHLPIRLLLGNEIYLDELMIEKIKNRECLPLGDTKYALLEFPMLNKPINLDYLISCLLEEGYNPIIAHPERYGWLMEDEEALDNLIGQGCLMQINTGSLTGLYGKTITKAAKTMVRRNKVHLVGTDAHSDRRRSPRMQESYEIMTQWTGQSYVDQIFYVNPAKVLKNTSPEVILRETEKSASESVYQPEHREGFWSALFMKLNTRKS